MDFGIPTLMEFPEAEELAAFCGAQGFGFVEMNMTFPWFQAEAISAQMVRAWKKRYGIGFTIHLHDQVNPFAFSPELRRGSLENIRFALALACEAGIPKITMHMQPGTYSTVNGRKTYLCAQLKDRYLELVSDFRRFAEEELQGSDTLLCVENTSGFLPYQREAIDLLLESQRFGLTFDIGHSFKAGGEDEGFILAHADRLYHFHIHDCSVKANHLALGAGGMEIARYVRLARERGCSVVTEVKESGALLRSKEYLMEMGLWH